jgi:phosphoribosyl 1,2-cyclic phosphate phosphodiesterase
MKLEFLGTGTSQGVPVISCACSVCTSNDPKDKRLRCSVLFRTGQQTILVDAGPDMRQQLLRSGIEELDAVLLTHEHMDHLSGMDDLRPFNFKQGKEMPIFANSDTGSAVRRVYAYAFSNRKYPGVPQFDLRRIDTEPFLVGRDRVIPIEVLHHKLPVLGFRLGDITYITDAKTISSEEKEKVRGSKVLVLNALRREPHPSHLNLDEALRLIAELEPEQAYLTHISHLFGCHQEIQDELPKGVNVAYDGLVIET